MVKPGAVAYKAIQKTIDNICQFSQHSYLLPFCYWESWYMAGITLHYM